MKFRGYKNKQTYIASMWLTHPGIEELVKEFAKSRKKTDGAYLSFIKKYKIETNYPYNVWISDLMDYDQLDKEVMSFQ